MIEINYDLIQSKLLEFLKFKTESIGYIDFDNIDLVDPGKKDIMYTQSFKYIKELSGNFHQSHHVYNSICGYIETLKPNSKIIDVGCASGLTGFRFIDAGHLVTFYDFEGIGLEFIRWFLKNMKYGNVHWVVPYGNSLPYKKYDAVVSIDVLEHTGNHLGYLKWLESFGDKFFISFPYVTKFYPPYIQVIDEWVDTDAIIMIIKNRYINVDIRKMDGRIYIDYEKR